MKNEVKVSLGGSHISADPTIIKRYPFFDFGITGEADITFPALAKKIIDHSGEVHGLYNGELPLDLDALPNPALHLVNFDICSTFLTKGSCLEVQKE